jgi:hypothetical protein
MNFVILLYWENNQPQSRLENLDILKQYLKKWLMNYKTQIHFSASINAEQLRGKVGGLYDPTIRLENSIENLSRDELVKRLKELQNKKIDVIDQSKIIDHEALEVTQENNIKDSK